MADDPTRTMPGAKVVPLEEALASADPSAGRYIEQGAIGHGGMGEVVLCVDRDIRRSVALKRMLPATAADPARRARFIEEAQVTGQLEHPNIVPIYELTREPDGSVYYTMKLVKGRSLADILRDLRDERDTKDQRDTSLAASRVTRQEPAPTLRDLLQAFLKVCDGVAFAHSRGVIHRDLKPANIMVGDYGEVLVMDWGLAKIVAPVGRRPEAVGGEDESRPASPVPRAGEEEEAESSATHAARGTRPEATPGIISDRQEMSALQTLAGSMMGSPGYMSPEQAKGELDKMDRRSDIFSLGAILYEILTLERAIPGETTYAILANTLKGNIVPPGKRASARNVPRELSAIAMKCLHRGRAHRYRSVLDLKRDLSLYLEGRSVSAAPDTFAQAFVKLVKRNKGISAAIAAAAVVVIALATFSYVRIARALGRAVASEAKAKANEHAAIAAQQQQRATALAASERFAKQAVRAAEFYRWDEAEQRAADAEVVCPDGPWALYAKGAIAQLKGDHSGACLLLKRSLGIAPKSPEVLKALTISQRVIQQASAAREALGKASDLKDWQVLAKLGDALFAAQDWPEALSAYAASLKFVSDGPSREDVAYKHGAAQAKIACRGFKQELLALNASEQIKRVAVKLAEIHGEEVPFSAGVNDDKWVAANFIAAQEGLRYLTPIEGVPLSSLALTSCHLIRSLEPLKGMPLQKLSMASTRAGDLSPLKGMPLEELNLNGSRVTDLSPLRGMRLRRLVLNNTGVSDLGPLQGMPLTHLDCYASPVADLTPLKGAPLERLDCFNTRIGDLGPLNGMPLTFLNCTNTPVSDLEPLRGMPLRELHVAGTRVTDLRPLEGMKLEFLSFSAHKVKAGVAIVRGMTSLKAIDDCIHGRMAAGEFWKKHDAGELK